MESNHHGVQLLYGFTDRPSLNQYLALAQVTSLWSISYLTAIVFRSRLIVTATKHRPSHIDDDKSPCLVGNNFSMRLAKEICVKALTGARWVCTTNARSARMLSRMKQIREPLLLRVTVKSGLGYRPLAPVRALIQNWCLNEAILNYVFVKESVRFASIYWTDNHDPLFSYDLSHIPSVSC